MSATRLLPLAAALLLAVFPLFVRLDSIPLHVFDEARLANNALEMTQNGNIWVTHYNGEPDLWNTKPPLAVWAQAICMYFFGYTELAVRLPSALCGLATALLLYWFCAAAMKDRLGGLLSVLVLVTTPGYVTAHVTRTGDYDAMLILWATAFLLLGFIGLEQGRSRTLLYGLLALALGILTKSVAPLFFLPGLLLYLLISGRWRGLLRNPYLYLGIAALILLVGGYYLWREHLSPGYLQAVWENELGGRFQGSLEAHREPAGFYLRRLWREAFVPWIFFLPVSILALFQTGRPEGRSLFLTLMSAGLGFLLVISLAQTKLSWYAAPLLPLLSLIVGLGLAPVLRAAARFFGSGTPYRRRLSLALLLLALGGQPYFEILRSVYVFQDRAHAWESRQYGPFLQGLKGKYPLTVAQWGYQAHIQFYVKALRAQGYQIGTRSPVELQVGNYAVVCEETPRAFLDELYQYRTLERYRECLLVEITAVNPATRKK